MQACAAQAIGRGQARPMLTWHMHASQVTHASGLVACAYGRTAPFLQGQTRGKGSLLMTAAVMQVAMDLPSIKATLSDREYTLIVSMAGDNFGEEQRVPSGAVWLEETLQAQEEQDKGSG